MVRVKQTMQLKIVQGKLLSSLTFYQDAGQKSYLEKSIFFLIVFILSFMQCLLIIVEIVY
jgi:hypothetical protein